MVSGIVALLQQAFPNHTNEAIVDRILASAKNDWFTATGETTFTTHGASIKHGYHSTWGHGFPDAYAALSQLLQVVTHYHLAVVVEVEAGLVEVGLEVGDQYLFQH